MDASLLRRLLRELALAESKAEARELRESKMSGVPMDRLREIATELAALARQTGLAFSFRADFRHPHADWRGSDFGVSEWDADTGLPRILAGGRL